jgi:ABC-type branched-subunit amino acid transport system substrate-binding protein
MSSLIRTFFLGLLPLLLAAQSESVFSQDKTTEPIRIGRSLALTGALASYGQAKKSGGEAYVERINREGGIRGRKIDFITLDDRYEPKETAKNINTFNGSGVTAVLGLFGVPTVAAVLPLIEELKLPTVGLTSGAGVVRAPQRRYVFPVRASYSDESDAMVSHFTSLGMKRVAIVRQTNPYGTSVAENMQASLAKIGIKSIADIEIAVDGSDAKAVAEKLAAIGETNVVFLAMLSGPATLLIEEMRAANIQTAAGIFSVSAVDTTVLAAKLKDKARGVAISQIVPLMQESMPLVREYFRDLKALGGNIPPSFYGLEGYIEARVLMEGLKRTNGPLTREALVAALEALGNYDAGGITIAYGPGKHEGMKFVELTMISRNGALLR